MEVIKQDWTIVGSNAFSQLKRGESIVDILRTLLAINNCSRRNF
jgi:hypothetical protein